MEELSSKAAEPGFSKSFGLYSSSLSKSDKIESTGLIDDFVGSISA